MNQVNHLLLDWLKIVNDVTISYACNPNNSLQGVRPNINNDEQTPRKALAINNLDC